MRKSQRHQHLRLRRILFRLNPELSEAVLSVRKSGGFFDLTPTWSSLLLRGPDAESFLQAIITQNTAALEPGSFRAGAILDKKSYLQADFYFSVEVGGMRILSRSTQIPRIRELLESYHFAEDVRIETAPASEQIILFQGNADPEWVNELSASGLSHFSLDLSGDGGRIFFGESAALVSIRELAGKNKISFCSDEVLDLLTLEAGLPIYSQDTDASVMAMEVWNYESFINFKKGCYPGQEIVARTYSQGEVRRRLFGLTCEAAVGWENLLGAKDFWVNGKKAGEVRRAAYSPTLKKMIALAYLPREMAYPGMDFEIEYEGKKHRVRVAKPPFYVKPSLAGSARAAYEAGMSLYHQGEWQAASKKFEESQKWLPAPDTCEALALTLERLGKTDESILWNQRFAELDPNAVMARTNLSRLYMQKGMSERAEKEQAKATALGFRLAA
ncbi:MAG: hypothetical protein JNM63_05915, partial [Spirochaetia bacterium]|nr:hypothetical protein [Spirochaetia bacterium]